MDLRDTATMLDQHVPSLPATGTGDGGIRQATRLPRLADHGHTVDFGRVRRGERDAGRLQDALVYWHTTHAAEATGYPARPTAASSSTVMTSST